MRERLWDLNTHVWFARQPVLSQYIRYGLMGRDSFNSTIIIFDKILPWRLLWRNESIEMVFFFKHNILFILKCIIIIDKIKRLTVYICWGF